MHHMLMSMGTHLRMTTTLAMMGTPQSRSACEDRQAGSQNQLSMITDLNKHFKLEGIAAYLRMVEERSLYDAHVARL
jgi:hypothetical protein